MIKKYNHVSHWLKRETEKYYSSVEREMTATGLVKDLYRYITSCTKEKSKPTVALSDQDGEIQVDPKKRANMLAQYFQFSYTLDNGESSSVSFPENDFAFPRMEITRTRDANYKINVSRSRLAIRPLV